MQLLFVKVWIPYIFTSFSNAPINLPDLPEFEYHISLHHSQTSLILIVLVVAFEYHISLHHSQTQTFREAADVLFEYHISLHHSQTASRTQNRESGLNTIYLYIILKLLQRTAIEPAVWIPYIFTSFSNDPCCGSGSTLVWIPYIFTSFSNAYAEYRSGNTVWIPYIFTSFSNLKFKNDMPSPA